MSRTHLIAPSCALLGIGLTGCSPVFIASPPPVTMPTELIAASEGDAKVDVGVQAAQAVMVGAIPLGLETLNAVPLRAEFGISPRVQLGLGAAPSSDRSYLHPSISAGVDLRQTEHSRLGLTVGLATVQSEGSTTEQVPAVDEQGQPIYDENGEAAYYTVEKLYGYQSVTPSVGLRGQRQLAERCDLVYMARASMSQGVTLYGDPNVLSLPWVDLGAGVVVEPIDDLRLGASVQVTAAPMLFLLNLPTLVASAGYTFGAAE